MASHSHLEFKTKNFFTQELQDNLEAISAGFKKCRIKKNSPNPYMSRTYDFFLFKTWRVKVNDY